LKRGGRGREERKKFKKNIYIEKENNECLRKGYKF